MGAIERSDLSPERTIFEVTESEEVKDDGHLRNMLGIYRGNGFRIALDDLGAGYASLKPPRRPRPDFVKLDVSLIQGVDRDP
jgi:EAL domain-containing protein (putative c-di-GMP-specific phosphodiesterase class I)